MAGDLPWEETYQGWMLTKHGSLLHWPNAAWPDEKGGSQAHGLCGAKLHQLRTKLDLANDVPHEYCIQCMDKDLRGIILHDERVSTVIRRPVATARVTLTSRELELISLFASGNSTEECAKRLGITARRVQYIQTALCKSLGAKNRTHLVALALRRKLIR